MLRGIDSLTAMDKRIPYDHVTAILGPTAVGKTDYALDLARQTGAEIISADAFQIYRGMDIGTAKVSAEIRAKIPHHLIDIQNPAQPYSAAQFVRDVDRILVDIRGRGKPAILCGGTAFYLYAWAYQFDFSSPQTLTIPPDWKALSNEALWTRLHDVDRDLAAQIPVANRRRVERAMAQFLLSGEKPSTMRRKSQTPRPGLTVVGLDAPREVVYDRINARVESMLDRGWMAEVETLLKQGYGPADPGFQAIGYRDIVTYLHDGMGREDLVKSIQAQTRHFAKRQWTWYQKFHANWIQISPSS